MDLCFRFYGSKKDSYDFSPVYIPAEPAPQQKSCAQPRTGDGLKGYFTIDKNVSTK